MRAAERLAVRTLPDLAQLPAYLANLTSPSLSLGKRGEGEGEQ